MLKDLKTVILVSIGCVAGMLANHLLPTAFAGDEEAALKTTGIQIVDQQKRLRAALATSGGGVALWLFDESGRPRLTTGIYGEGAERGQPHLVLSDPTGQATVVLRTIGPHDSPVLVFKARGKDRLIAGLNFSTEAQEPFMVRISDSGEQTKVFGTYP